MPLANECAHFIPLVTDELVELCCRDPGLAALDRDRLRQLAVAIGDTHHLRYHRRQLDLKTAYAPFDPDGESVSVRPLSAEQRQHRLNDLMSDLTWLLERAHYRHLGRDAFESVLAEASEWGIRMRVDFSIFAHVAVFVRGESFEERSLCNWRTLFQERRIEVPIFRRLVLAFKLRPGLQITPNSSPEYVYLKLFKDIPRVDVDMLMPGARVRLKLLDRGKLGVGALSGMGTMAYRVLTQFGDAVEISMMTIMTLWGLTAGAFGYGYKSYFDYQTTRQAYHLNLTQSLYFQNLDSNAGVLTRLFDEAEEQETRTALLAYFCLLRHGHEGISGDDLEAAMGLYLDRYAGVPLVCLPGVPLELLGRLGLVQASGSRVVALPLESAVERVHAVLEGDKPGSVKPSLKSPSGL